MAKKNKKNTAKQFDQVMEKVRDLGLGGKDTLHRLATTVRAEMPTLIVDELAKGGDGKRADKSAKLVAGGPFSARLKTGVKVLAHQINPFGEPAGARKVARELKLLNKQVKRVAAGPKPRRSRLPYAIAFTLALLGGGGYWLMANAHVPDVKISQYVDYKNWFEKTAGIVGHNHKETPMAERREAPNVSQPVTKQAIAVIPKAPGHILIGRSSPGAVGAREAKVAAAKHVTKITAKANKKAGKKSNLAKLDRKGKAAKARVARYDRDQ